MLDLEKARSQELMDRVERQDTRTSRSSDSSHGVDTMSIRPAPRQNLGGGVAGASSNLYRPTSHVSGPDALEPDTDGEHGAFSTTSGDPYREAGDDIYDRLSQTRKSVIVAVLSFCAFLSPVSSTSVLAATPEVAAAYNTTGSVINASNAGYMAFMAISPVIWGPMSQVFGRRQLVGEFSEMYLTKDQIGLVNAAAFLVLSLGTALAPNIAAFFAFRAFSAVVGTSFILIGSACLGDIYRPTERGTAMGWFMSGTLIGPAFGPFLGGIIVTYSSWRTIFWLQTALAGAGALGLFFFVPETIHHMKIADLEGYSRAKKTKAILGMINPIRVLRLFRHLNLVLGALSSGSLVWNMYSLLTPIRYVLNPRFSLESPLLSGLFYLAPGVGYLCGTFVGGRWADWTVKYWIRRRGVRVPEDRLWSLVPFAGVLIPGCILIYGWTVDKEVGGIPVPVIVLFLQGVAQLCCFPALNTYCLDVLPGRGAEVAAANYFMRYMAGCLATAVVLPIIQAIGVGWFSTISAALLIAATTGVIWAARRGDAWTKSVIATTGPQQKQRQTSASNNVAHLQNQAEETKKEEQA